MSFSGSGLIEFSGQYPHTEKVRITTVGAYHINYLITLPIYYNAVVTDTPIFNDVYSKEIRDIEYPQLPETLYLIKRKERAEWFKMYLDDVWEKHKGNFSHITSTFNWEDIVLE